MLNNAEDVQLIEVDNNCVKRHKLMLQPGSIEWSWMSTKQRRTSSWDQKSLQRAGFWVVYFLVVMITESDKSPRMASQLDELILCVPFITSQLKKEYWVHRSLLQWSCRAFAVPEISRHPRAAQNCQILNSRPRSLGRKTQSSCRYSRVYRLIISQSEQDEARAIVKSAIVCNWKVLQVMAKDRHLPSNFDGENPYSWYR